MRRRSVLASMLSVGTIAIAGCSGGTTNEMPSYSKYLIGPNQQDPADASFWMHDISQLQDNFGDEILYNNRLTKSDQTRNRRSNISSELKESFGYELSEDKAVVFEADWFEYTGNHYSSPMLVLIGVDGTSLKEAIEANSSEYAEKTDYGGMTHFNLSDQEIAVNTDTLIFWGGGFASMRDYFKYTKMATDAMNQEINNMDDYSPEFKTGLQFLDGESNIEFGYYYNKLDSSDPNYKNRKAGFGTRKIIDSNTAEEEFWAVFSDDISSRVDKEDLREPLENGEVYNLDSIEFVQNNVVKYNNQISVTE